MMKNLLTFSLFLLSITTPLTAATGGPDFFGYTWKDSNDASAGAPVYEWIPPTLGNPVVPPGGIPSAVIEMNPPVVFYGVSLSQMMVSRYGYVTFDPTDFGLDSSNDCPFPAVPDIDNAARIAVMHDALGPIGNINTAGIFHQYYAESPHPHHRCGVHVITWKDVAHNLSTETFSFQLLMFDNFDMIMQYGPNPENGSGSSTGLQSGVPSGGSILGLKVACNFAGGIPDNYAILFEPPTVVVGLTSDAASPAGGTSLREAWEDSPNGTKVVFNAALNGATILRDPALDPLGDHLIKNLSFDASGLPQGLTISGGSVTPITFIQAHNHFSNIDFVYAKPDPNLGTIGRYSNSGAVTVTACSSSCPVGTFSDCEFKFNEGDKGAAVRINLDAKVFASNCYFLANNATGDSGGAVQALGGGEVSLHRCDFTLNTAALWGGALFADPGSRVTISESAFSVNNTNSGGGAVYANEAEMEINACLFNGNSAFTEGGAITVLSTPLKVSDSTFSGNSARIGAAIATIRGEEITIDWCTFADNDDASSGEEAGLWADVDSSVVVRGSIFSHSNYTTPNYFDGDGSYISNGNNLTDTSSILNDGSDLNNTDPLLGPLSFNGGPTRTHALPANSPALDTLTALSGNDQRGYSRLASGGADRGAYEFQGNLVVTTATDEMITPGSGLSLREAIRDAGPGSVITFASSLNGDTISLSTFFGGQGETLKIAKDITIDASALSNGITLDGFNSMRVVRVEEFSSVSLDNVDIANGSLLAGDPFGGGAGLLATENSDVSFSNGTIRSCSSGNPGGGAAVNFACSLTLINSTVAGNSSTADGGGIHAAGTLTLQRSAIGNNTATGKGGGIATVGGSTVVLSRSTIARNSAGSSGGGIALSETPGSLENLTISGNSSDSSGGGIYGFNSQVAIDHCTIADNIAASLAGGLVTATFQDGGNPTLSHCIFAANQLDGSGLKNIRAFDQDAEPESAGYNLIDDDSFDDAGATDMEEQVAYLAPLAHYGGSLQTHALLAISRAIDGGDPSVFGAPSKDQRGYSRIADGRNFGVARIDIGAHEAANPVFVGKLVDVSNGVGAASLRGAIGLAGAGGRVLFRQSLNGGVIDLSTAAGGEGIPLLVDKSIQIDATRLPDGITISGGDESRVFDVTGGADVAMHALRVEDGFTGGSADGGGFRILGNADLLLTHSSVSGNRARDGGGFHVSGGGSARLQNVTVSGNTAQREGATIKLVGAAASATLEHCSVIDQLLAGTGIIGGISMGAGKLSLYSTVMADIAGSQLSSDDYANFTSLGYNLSDSNGALIGGLLTATGDQFATNPVVSALLDPGGWSKVHRYQATSALHDAGDPDASLLPALSATGGVRSVGQMDIGAQERTGLTIDSDSDGMLDYWENLYGFDINDAADATQDADGDVINNLAEFLASTNPLRSDLVIEVPTIVGLELAGISDTLAVVEFTSQEGVSYVIEYSSDLVLWDDLVIVDAELGSATTRQLVTTLDLDRYFVRVRAVTEE